MGECKIVNRECLDVDTKSHGRKFGMLQTEIWEHTTYVRKHAQLTAFT